MSGRVTEDLLAQLANTKWAQRQAALQEVSAMLASTGNCIGADVGELVPALKARLAGERRPGCLTRAASPVFPVSFCPRAEPTKNTSPEPSPHAHYALPLDPPPPAADSNKNLVVQAIEVSAQLATAMGKAFQKEGKALLEASLLSLSDRRPQARAAVVAMLEACAAACGPDWVVHDVRAAVGSPRCSGEGRQTALLFLSNAVRQYAASLSPGSLADVLLVAHLGQADRTAEAREGAAALLAAVAEAVAPAAVASALPALRCPDPVAARAGIEAALSRAGIDVPQLRPGHSSHPSAPHPSSSAAAPNARGPARAGPPAAALRRSTTAVTRPATGVQRGTAALRVSASARLVGSSKAPAGAAAEDAFLTADSGKATRARRMRVVRVPVKWDDPRPEEHDELKAELAGVAGPALLGEMFSRDFRKHCSAAERIKAAASGAEHERVVGSLDLVLQWAALRVCESNTQVRRWREM